MTNSYFGPEFARKSWEVQVPTPVGELCGHCEEPIEEGDAGTFQAYLTVASSGTGGATVRPVHYECSMRQVIGSASHVKGICSCNIPGSTEGDDPSLTRRQAALAATRAWNETRRA